MAARSPSSPVGFNFDGLTDCITNLAGSLILLVVIVFALTVPKETGSDQPDFPSNKVGAEVPMQPLVDKIQVLRSDTERLTQKAQQIEESIPKLTAEIEELEELARKGKR